VRGRSTLLWRKMKWELLQKLRAVIESDGDIFYRISEGFGPFSE
jgi:hypothetical protein